MTEPGGRAGCRGCRTRSTTGTRTCRGGWLRAATFGAMDGLVSNTALIAGVAASASAHTVVLSGVAGLLAGAFSMALGEYTSVTTANEQIESEVRVERRSFRRHPRPSRPSWSRCRWRWG